MALAVLVEGLGDAIHVSTLFSAGDSSYLSDM